MDKQVTKEKIMNNYSWFPNEKGDYTIVHKNNSEDETFMAICKDAEKAHFLTTAANQYRDQQPQEEQENENEIWNEVLEPLFFENNLGLRNKRIELKKQFHITRNK